MRSNSIYGRVKTRKSTIVKEFKEFVVPFLSTIQNVNQRDIDTSWKVFLEENAGDYKLTSRQRKNLKPPTLKQVYK